MIPSKYFKNSVGHTFCVARYNQPIDMVTVTWHGVATKDSVRSVRDGILDLLLQSGCPYLLNDMEQLVSVSSEEFISWLRDEWDVTAAQFGLRYIADLVRKDSIAADYLKKIRQGRESAANDLKIAAFYNRFDALQWLMEQQALNKDKG